MDAMSALFEQIYGHPPRYRGRANGQVALMGDTRILAGPILATCIPQATECRIGLRGDDLVWAATVNAVPRSHPIEVFRLGDEVRVNGWVDYVQSVTRILGYSASHASTDAFELEGFELLVSSDVPMGSGFASSAAFEVGLLRGLREAYDLQVDDDEIAKLAERAGLMFFQESSSPVESMLPALADQESALLISQRLRRYERIRWPEESMKLFVFHTGAVFDGVTELFRERYAECRQAAQILKIASLAELHLDDLPKLSNLPAKLENRVRHFIFEAWRVEEAAHAIREGHPEKLGALLTDSCRSLVKHFDLELPELTTLIDRVCQESEVYGARVSGGRAGGALCVLAHPDAGSELARRILEFYREETGREGRCLMPYFPPEVSFQPRRSKSLVPETGVF